jgi:hypothetical protein
MAADHKFEWEVQVEVFCPDLTFMEHWWEISQRLHHPRVDVQGHGFQDEPDGLYGSASFLVDAAGADEAEAIATSALDEFLASAEKPYAEDPAFSRKLEASPVSDHDTAIEGPRYIESRDVAIPWHRHHPVGDGRLVKVVSMAGPESLQRVDVEELPERVTITFWQHLPAVHLERDTVHASAASAITRCVEVTLTEPLGDRPVYDGATGERPDQIRPGDYGERGWRSGALALDLEAYPCSPTPSPPQSDGGAAARSRPSTGT